MLVQIWSVVVVVVVAHSYCIALQLVLVVVTENKQESEMFMAVKKGKVENTFIKWPTYRDEWTVTWGLNQ